MCIVNNSVFDLTCSTETFTAEILVVWFQAVFLNEQNFLSSEFFLWYNPYEKVIDYITHIALNQEWCYLESDSICNLYVAICMFMFL